MNPTANSSPGRQRPGTHQRTGRTGALQEPRSVAGLNAIRQSDIQRDEGESWMVVYLDVLTLLLVTFVLVSAHIQKTQGAANHIPPIKDSRAQAAEVAPAKTQVTQQNGVLDGGDGLLQEKRLVETLKATPGLEDLEVSIETGKVNLTLPERILFDTGQADLLGGARKLLDKIAPVLAANGAPVSVEGHTDSRPIATGRFPSNWELSASRATTVVRALAERAVAPRLMRAIGYGDTQPVDSNDTADGRSRNRRVLLVIHLNERQATPPPSNP
jgi:chemotaxis protein MotB